MIDYFANDRYRVLECMKKSQIKVGDKLIIKLSQQEIAEILGFTKSKVNSIIGELKEFDYIVQLSSRGKYVLTEKANKEIVILEKEDK